MCGTLYAVGETKCGRADCAIPNRARANGGTDHCRRPTHWLEPRPVKPDNVTAEQLVEAFGSHMHAAAVLGTATHVLSLAACGHDVQSCDNLGRTPCHVAAIAGNSASLRSLVHLGAHLEVEDHAGASPLQYAAQFDSPHLVEWIKWCIWSGQQQPCDGGPTSRRHEHLADGSPAVGVPSSHAAASIPPGASICTRVEEGRGGEAIARAEKRMPRAQTEGSRVARRAGGKGDSPEFAWKEAAMQNRMRRLAGILLLAMPDVAMHEEELLNILHESEDDMVRAVAIARIDQGSALSRDHSVSFRGSNPT